MDRAQSIPELFPEEWKRFATAYLNKDHPCNSFKPQAGIYDSNIYRPYHKHRQLELMLDFLKPGDDIAAFMHDEAKFPPYSVMEKEAAQLAIQTDLCYALEAFSRMILNDNERAGFMPMFHELEARATAKWLQLRDTMLAGETVNHGGELIGHAQRNARDAILKSEAGHLAFYALIALYKSTDILKCSANLGDLEAQSQATRIYTTDPTGMLRSQYHRLLDLTMFTYDPSQLSNVAPEGAEPIMQPVHFSTLLQNNLKYLKEHSFKEMRRESGLQKESRREDKLRRGPAFTKRFKIDDGEYVRMVELLGRKDPPENYAMLNEEFGRIAKYINMLPRRMQDVLMLLKGDGMSLVDTSSAIGLVDEHPIGLDEAKQIITRATKEDKMRPADFADQLKKDGYKVITRERVRQVQEEAMEALMLVVPEWLCRKLDPSHTSLGDFLTPEGEVDEDKVWKNPAQATLAARRMLLQVLGEGLTLDARAAKLDMGKSFPNRLLVDEKLPSARAMDRHIFMAKERFSALAPDPEDRVDAANALQILAFLSRKEVGISKSHR